jgi:glutamate formiminotransferase/glutamate formiminotransferase/formiminotetrahydrofolate cyclodeaminase
MLAESLRLPVLLYGELAAGRTRAQLRSGGTARLAERIVAGELRPDFGPASLHPTAGATLLAARPPLVAFNLELSPPAGLAEAQTIAAQVREGGTHGLPGLRALGVPLRHWIDEEPRKREIGQVSMNVEDPLSLPLRMIVAAVAERARALGASIAAAELVGLAPSAALDGFPLELPLRGFDPERHLLENALRAA